MRREYSPLAAEPGWSKTGAAVAADESRDISREGVGEEWESRGHALELKRKGRGAGIQTCSQDVEKKSLAAAPKAASVAGNRGATTTTVAVATPAPTFTKS